MNFEEYTSIRQSDAVAALECMEYSWEAVGRPAQGRQYDNNNL